MGDLTTEQVKAMFDEMMLSFLKRDEIVDTQVKIIQLASSSIICGCGGWLIATSLLHNVNLGMLINGIILFITALLPSFWGAYMDNKLRNKFKKKFKAKYGISKEVLARNNAEGNRSVDN